MLSDVVLPPWTARRAVGEHFLRGIRRSLRLCIEFFRRAAPVSSLSVWPKAGIQATGLPYFWSACAAAGPFGIALRSRICFNTALSTGHGGGWSISRRRLCTAPGGEARAVFACTGLPTTGCLSRSALPKKDALPAVPPSPASSRATSHVVCVPASLTVPCCSTRGCPQWTAWKCWGGRPDARRKQCPGSSSRRPQQSRTG
jgi:hypothetical protein